MNLQLDDHDLKLNQLKLLGNNAFYSKIAIFAPEDGSEGQKRQNPRFFTFKA